MAGRAFLFVFYKQDKFIAAAGAAAEEPSSSAHHHIDCLAASDISAFFSAALTADDIFYLLLPQLSCPARIRCETLRTAAHSPAHIAPHFVMPVLLQRVQDIYRRMGVFMPGCIPEAFIVIQYER